MRVLGIIPARGGSKGIPRKNLALLAGKPLLAYTAEAALAARRLSRVVLSTDDEEIAAVGRSLGLEVPFMRPPELARDDTPTLPVLQDVVRKLAAAGDIFDAVFILQPTTPLRSASDIDGSIELLQQTGADAVVGLVDVGEKHPARMNSVDGEGRVTPASFAKELQWSRRQDLPTYYLRSGSVYLTRTACLERGELFGKDCRAWIVPAEWAANIDEPIDMVIAEAYLQRREAKR